MNKDTDLAITWHLFAEDYPNQLDRGRELLHDFLNDLQISPLEIDGKELIYEARYELLGYNGNPKYGSAIGSADGFIDFLIGFPYEEAELLGILFEETKADRVEVIKAGDGDPTPPMPEDLFGGFPAEDILHDYLVLETDEVEHLAPGLPGEPEPELLWWTRYRLRLTDKKRFKPGDFAVLAVRLFPGKYWGAQGSNPFVFSGNWLDTVYHTSAVVIEVLPPDKNRTYPMYKVRWRKSDDDEGDIFYARPSGFETYEINERVTVLKDPGTDRTTQTWKDDQQWQEEIWRLVPLTFFETGDGNDF